MNQHAKEFNDLQAAVDLLRDVLSQADSFEAAAARLLARQDNRFHSFDLLGYVTQIQNALMTGTDLIADAVDPGVEGG